MLLLLLGNAKWTYQRRHGHGKQVGREKASYGEEFASLFGRGRCEVRGSCERQGSHRKRVRMSKKSRASRSGLQHLYAGYFPSAEIDKDAAQMTRPKGARSSRTAAHRLRPARPPLYHRTCAAVRRGPACAPAEAASHGPANRFRIHFCAPA